MLRSYYSVDGVAANLLSTIAITKVVSNSLCGAHGNIRTYNLLHLTFLAYSLTLCRAMTLTSLFRAVPKEADNVVQGSIPIHMQQQHSRARFSSPDMHRENSCPFYPPPPRPSGNRFVGLHSDVISSTTRVPCWCAVELS